MLRSNQGVISGNIVAKADYKEVGEKSKPVARVRIAHNDRYENAHFFPVECWNGVAKSVLSVPVGTLVQVYYSLKQSRWEEDGQKRSSIVLVATAIDFVRYPEGHTGKE